MPTPVQADCRNRLLALTSREDFVCLTPRLERSAVRKSNVLVEMNGLVEYVYFPEDGLGSIIATSPEGLEVEAGILGLEGCGPISPVLASDHSPQCVICQMAGSAYRIDRESLVDLLDQSRSLRTLLLRYVQVLGVQTAFTALSNAVHPIDERLARWLLMCHDRLPSNEIVLTHEFLSLMLAVRRPSVTTALHVLEGNGFIRSERSNITVRDRAALEKFAGDSYGRPEAEYRRLIGPL